MTDGSRDRFGDKINDAEKAREDQWARQQDQELIEKMRHRHAGLKCPECGEPLNAEAPLHAGAMVCPKDHGAWLDREALNTVRQHLKR
ncbi:MAG TPA: hypothetical protein VHY56_10650 [Candidatus Binataceae bacterium]|nr:hypothetical protein [Candidatus Binataceae bacterium]